jgi:hypothetical protein
MAGTVQPLRPEHRRLDAGRLSPAGGPVPQGVGSVDGLAWLGQRKRMLTRASAWLYIAPLLGVAPASTASRSMPSPSLSLWTCSGTPCTWADTVEEESPCSGKQAPRCWPPIMGAARAAGQGGGSGAGPWGYSQRTRWGSPGYAGFCPLSAQGPPRSESIGWAPLPYAASDRQRCHSEFLNGTAGAGRARGALRGRQGGFRRAGPVRALGEGVMCSQDPLPGARQLGRWWFPCGKPPCPQLPGASLAHSGTLREASCLLAPSSAGS